MRAAAFLALAGAFTGYAAAQPTAPDVARMMAVGRLWVTVQYFHPYLEYKNINWDRALTDALPSIRHAQNAAEYAEGLNRMLTALADNETIAGAPKPAEATASNAKIAPQRFRFHHGLAPFDHSPSPFFSGMLTRTDALPQSVELDMGDGVVARVRLSEPVDATTPVGAAMAVSNKAELTAYPDEGMRAIAAFRLWGAVRYFFAYKDLMDDDWDRIFERYLPKIVNAKDVSQYQLTIAELVSHLLDSGAEVTGTEINRYFGEAFPDIRVRLLEKKVMITELGPSAAASGLKVGDAVEEVDGENISDRIKREANYLSAATPASLGELVANRLLNGSNGSEARLMVTQSPGTSREVRLKRLETPVWNPRAEAVRMVKPGIGYMDLTRLSARDLEQAFSKLANASGIVFDLRGESSIDPSAIVTRLPSDHRQAMVVTGPIAERPDLPQRDSETSTASYFSIVTVPLLTNHSYGGKVAALIDARTRGKSERLAIALQAVEKANLFGLPSAGSPAEITRMQLPGGLTVSFSGQDVRLLNGGPIERTGLQPNESVPTTLNGIRAGRDEALQRALGKANMLQ